MTTIKGELLINNQWVPGEEGTYRAVNPATGETIGPELGKASREQVNHAVDAARAAAPEFRRMPLARRAAFLRGCADAILDLGDILVERVMLETGLPRARVEGERGRTCGQLRLFADTVEAGDFLDVRIDTALPERRPLPRPDLRYMNQAVGPVVVFGASNFPLAFSVAGGDTASALAAGCPVLVKGHSSHPGTSELVARAVAHTAAANDMPGGVFSLLMGSGREVGVALVGAPAVQAVGFTGSLASGMALVKLAAERPEPIPVFTEMGSLNPVLLLPEALASQGDAIAEEFVESLTMGTGQFCTNPGLVLGVEGPDLERFIAEVKMRIAQKPAGVMLNQSIGESFAEGVAATAAQPGVETPALGEPARGLPGFCGQATLMTVDARTFTANSQLTEEMFGPAALLVECRDLAEMEAVVTALGGQLTGTLHGTEAELAAHGGLVDALLQRVGRLLVNGFPTGVEVCHAMVHGGPFPATSDARFTSVGTAAIRRFLRPVCLQNYPPGLLPDPLRDDNPLGLRRLVNGQWTTGPIQRATDQS